MYFTLGNLVKAYATYFRQGFNLFNETETYMKTLDDKIQVFPEGSGPVYGKMFLVTIIFNNPDICTYMFSSLIVTSGIRRSINYLEYSRSNDAIFNEAKNA